MPLTISKLKMWKNPGYTRGCLEIPPAGSKLLPAVPDYISPVGETLRPRKGSTLTSIELPLSYSETFEMSYLYMEASDGKGSIALFGWIDSVEIIATAEEAVRISWSVDWWRSYSGDAVFGRGNITKCGNSAYKRPYRTEPRMWKVTKYEKLINLNDQNYPYNVVIIYNETDNGVTSINYAFWQCSLTAGKDTIAGQTNPSLRDIYDGRVDELLGLDPTAITGIFIVPYLSWTPNPANILSHNTSFAYKKPQYASATFGSSFTTTYETNDLKKAVIIDPTGAVVATLPWGYSCDAIGGYADVGTVAAHTRVNLGLSNQSTSLISLAAEGMSIDVPGLACPVNSNAFSSYVYSGQREYDRRSKEIQRNASAIQGIGNIGGSVIGGAIAGSAVAPGPGTLAGAVGGAASSLIGTAVSYGVSAVADDHLMQATEQLYSNQSSNVLITAGGEGWAYAAGVRDWYIVQLEGDSTSKAEYTAAITYNGYDTDIPTGNVTTFITAGGPLQIRDLTVTGSIPPAAKLAIKVKLESGCYIVENNSSGVIP